MRVKEQKKEQQPLEVKHSLRRGRKKHSKNQPKEIITAKGSFSSNYLNNQLEIENKYASLISLIDTIYPPLMCTLCDTISTSRIQSNIHFNEKHKLQKRKKSRYLCIHPHCDQSFLSRATLRFHISHSHLVHWAKKPLPDPTFVYGNEEVETLVQEEEGEEEEEEEEEEQDNVNSPAMIEVTTPAKVYMQQEQQQQKTANNNHIKTPSLSPPTKRPLTINNNKKHKLSPSPAPPPPSTTNNKKLKVSALIHNDDLLMTTPSPPPSPFSLYHPKKPSKKPQLSTRAENFLNIHYPPLQCPCCSKIFNRKTNVIKHLTESHIGQEPYKCMYDKCAHPRLYATREGLVYHIARVHDHEEE